MSAGDGIDVCFVTSSYTYVFVTSSYTYVLEGVRVSAGDGIDVCFAGLSHDTGYAGDVCEQELVTNFAAFFVC